MPEQNNDLLDTAREAVSNVGPDYRSARDLQDKGYAEQRQVNGALVAALRGMPFDDESIMRAKMAAGLLAPTRSGSSAEGWGNAANAYADTKTAQQKEAFDRALKIAAIQEAGAKILNDQAQAKLGMMGTSLQMPNALLGAGQGMIGAGAVGSFPDAALNKPSSPSAPGAPGGGGSPMGALGALPGMSSPSLPPGSRPASMPPGSRPASMPPGGPGLPPRVDVANTDADAQRLERADVMAATGSPAKVQTASVQDSTPSSSPSGDLATGETPPFTTKAAQQAWVRYQQLLADPRTSGVPLFAAQMKQNEEAYKSDAGYQSWLKAKEARMNAEATAPVQAATKQAEATNEDERKQLDAFRQSAADAQKTRDAVSKVDAARQNLRFGADWSTGPVMGRISQATDSGADAVNEAIGTMRAGVIKAQNVGAISNYEQKIYAQQVPGLTTREGSAKIMEQAADIAAQRVQEQEKFMRNYRAQNGTLDGAVEQWNKFVQDRPIIGSNPKNGAFEIYKGNVGGWEAYLKKPDAASQRMRPPPDTRPSDPKLQQRLLEAGKIPGAAAAPAATPGPAPAADPALIAAARAELAKRLAAQQAGQQ